MPSTGKRRTCCHRPRRSSGPVIGVLVEGQEGKGAISALPRLRRDRPRDSGVVPVEKWDTIETALKRFKKSCIAAGVFQEIAKRRLFLPSSERRRLKSKRNAQRRARAARRRLENGADLYWKPERA